jgi:hypothetical protein
LIDYCDALIIALKKKRAIQKLHDRYAALQRGELLTRHHSLLRTAFEGLKLNIPSNDVTKKDHVEGKKDDVEGKKDDVEGQKDDVEGQKDDVEG